MAAELSTSELVIARAPNFDLAIAASDAMFAFDIAVPTEIPPEPNANVEPSSLICNSPVANSRPLFAARSTAMVSGDVPVLIAIPSPPWNPSITEPETSV